MIYVPGDNNKAYSRNCESEMHAQHGELVSHAKAEKKKKKKRKTHFRNSYNPHIFLEG